MTLAQLPTLPSEIDLRSDADRWRPTRAGLVRIWQFDDEVLEFERGRLVLYGPNGSGKTMALELLLPYLLDAQGQPGRLSTSGSDRGGLWSRVTGYEGDARTGYLWLEFRRDSGQTFTIGVRLRAQPSGNGKKHWFTTTLRVGHDLGLLDRRRVPLEVDALTKAIGEHGTVWGSDTGGYREAVRTTLFPGWSEERLAALIETLLVVRKQHVTDGLSPRVLSAHLSDALPGLDERVLGKVADGFAELDRRQDEIEALERDVRITGKLAKVNRDYAKLVVASVSHAVTRATTELDNVTKTERKLRGELEDKQQQAEALATEVTDLERQQGELEATLEGLRGSEAYRKGAQLDDLRRQASTAKDWADKAGKEAARQAEVAARAQDRADHERGEAERAAVQRSKARTELEGAAKRLGGEALLEIGDDALTAAANAWTDERAKAVADVRKALVAHAEACRDRDARRRDHDDCDRQLSDAESARSEAAAALETVTHGWEREVQQWIEGSVELPPHVPESIVDDWERAGAVVAEAQRLAEQPLVAERTTLEANKARIEMELAEAEQARRQWAEGKDPEPEAPAGRRDRTEVAGQPLWRIVQFCDDVDAAQRGRIEAALAESRLLDAWVSPDGTHALPDDLVDVVALGGSAPLDGPTLTEVLEVDPAASEVSETVVRSLLQAVVLVDRDAHEHRSPALVIGRDGSWRADRVAGRAPVDDAQFVGASSRAAARAARIAELDRKIAELEAARDGVVADLDTIERRLRACQAEAKALPSVEAIRAATRAVQEAASKVAHCEQALSRAVRLLDKADALATKRLRALSDVAIRHGLPTDAGKLDAIAGQLDTLRQRIGTFKDRAARAQAAQQRAATEAERAAEAREHADKRKAEAEERRREASELAAKLVAVERTIGVQYKKVLDEIDQGTKQRQRIRERLGQAQSQRREIEGQLGQLGGKLEDVEHRRAQAEAERAKVSDRFVAAAKDELLVAAEVPGAPEASALTSLTAILEAARNARSEGGLPAQYDDARRQRRSNQVSQQLGDAARQLMGRADLTFEATESGWSILRARREGVLSSADDLLVGLEAQLEAAQAELTKKQQALFEQILSGSVRDHLRERLWAARALVERINEILGRVRTQAGGVKVSLKWDIDPDLPDAAELRQAKKLLLLDSPLAEGRAELDAFLQGRIERVRADETGTGDWREHLARMLDYRAWHRFGVMVHHKRFGDAPRSLDSRKVSLSAGEKTIVMVLPLLAAVTSHYQPSADEPACQSPRLLLMDELFPKLDYRNKQQLLGLLPTLDLDAVFTSDKDRCEYDTLDAIAIHVFQKLEDDSSTTTRLVWNGSMLEVPAEAAL